MSQRVRTAIRVEGTVQGVGFRPFVYSLASRLGLGGVVGNDSGGVFAEVEGSPSAVRTFILALRNEAPPLARIERITTRDIQPNGSDSFAIAPSQPGGARRALVSADTATCADCLRELADPADRRFGYPFINCTNCGPRFTIVRDVPYDRPLTTMAGFAMCAACRAEYDDPGNRRFHAQPVGGLEVDVRRRLAPRNLLAGHRDPEPIGHAGGVEHDPDQLRRGRAGRSPADQPAAADRAAAPAA